MKNAASRRNWIKKISTGITGLVIAEHSFGKSTNIKETSAFNSAVVGSSTSDVRNVTPSLV